MKFKYYTDMFAKMLDFKGKSNLAEYWFCVLYNIIFSTLIALVGLPFVKDWNLFIIVCDSLSGMYNLIVFLPMLALTIRRLHDANHSGWSVLLLLIPIVGLIILIIYLVTPSAQTKKSLNEFKNEVLNVPNQNEYPFEEQTDMADNFATRIQSQNKEVQNNQISKNIQENKDQNDIAIVENIQDELKAQEQPSVAEQTEQPKPRQRKSKTSAPAKEKPLTRSQKITQLQQKQQNGEITEEEYHKQVMEILKH